MKLIVNFISKIGVDTIARLIGFLTLPVITRSLGPDGYGLFSYIFVILSYFGFFIDFGYLNYGTNKLCEKIRSETVIGRIISLQLVTLIFSFIILVIAGYLIFDSLKFSLLLIFAITWMSQIFAIKYYYLANNKLYFNSLAELAGQIVYAGLIFLVFVKFPSVSTLVILAVIQSVVTALFLFLPYLRKHKIQIDFNPGANIKTLKEAYKLGLSSKAEGITSSFIILCIGIFLTEESVGLYNASYKIYLILLTVVQGASYTLMPVLLRNVKNRDRISVQRISLIFYGFLIMGLILSFVTFTFSDQIIHLMFGEQFMDAVIILKSFSLTILLWPVVIFMSLVILAYNKYNFILLTSLSSMVFSIIISITFVNLFGSESTGLILPLVAAGTILVSLSFLKKISRENKFDVSELFSPVNAANELSALLRRK